MKTFRARLAFWIAASALGILLLSGMAVYASVRATLQEKQDEALLEITRTEIEGSSGNEAADPSEVSGTDESLLVWERTSGKIFLERGPVVLRRAMRSVSHLEFSELNVKGQAYRALYYPYEDNNLLSIALCVEPVAPLQSALRRIALRLSLIGILGAAAACLTAWHLATRLTRPLQQIANQTGTIHETALDQRLPRYSEDAELIAVTEGFNAMLARLESAFVAQGRFVANAAHELRSPLANVRTTAEVALRRQDPATHVRALEVTVSEIERLTRLTESLLTLSLADAGTLIQERTPLDLGEIALEAVEAIQPRAEAAGVSVLLERQSAPLSGDALRLRQVLDNLLDNAVRHSPAGGRVKVVVKMCGEEVCASVSDEGSGISETDRPHIFERLWRSDSARTRSTGGFGLGLAIVKAIVQAHGGEIRVSKGLPHGTNFDVRLPEQNHSK